MLGSFKQPNHNGYYRTTGSIVGWYKKGTSRRQSEINNAEWEGPRQLLEELHKKISMLSVHQHDAHPRDTHNFNDDDRGLRLEVLEFDGVSIDPEDYLEWERNL